MALVFSLLELTKECSEVMVVFYPRSRMFTYMEMISLGLWRKLGYPDKKCQSGSCVEHLGKKWHSLNIMRFTDVPHDPLCLLGT